MEPGVRRVTLLLERNGSLVLVPDGGEDAPALSGLAALLVVTFAGGLAINALLGAALLTCAPETAQSPQNQGEGARVGGGVSRARAAQTMLVVANALDCLLNVPVAATVVSSWTSMAERAPHVALGLCKFSAATAQLTSVLQTLSVVLVVLDRCLLLTGASSTSSSFSLTPGGSKSGTHRCGAAATRALLWGSLPLAAAISTPVGVRASVRVFPTRYGCGAVRADGEGLALACSVLSLGYLLPWALATLAVSMAARRAQQQRWRRRQLELAAQQQGRAQGTSVGVLSLGAADSPLGPLGPLTHEEYRALLLGAVLLFLYVVMLVPGILTVQTFHLLPVVPQSSTGPRALWPVVTGTYETVFVWLRFQFAVVTPSMIVILSRDVRKRVLEMVQCLCQACCCCCCRRDNAVAHAVTAPQGHRAYRYARQASRDRWTGSRRRAQHLLLDCKEMETTVSPGTSVLFATSQGLHLRTLAPSWGLSGATEDTDDVSTSVAGGANDSQPRYAFHFCDLAIIEDAAKSAPEAATMPVSNRTGLQHRPPVPSVQLEDHEPSMTREELQASLGRSRFLSSSCRKNVRFASVVSEIPHKPLSRLTEVPHEAEPTEPTELADKADSGLGDSVGDSGVWRERAGTVSDLAVTYVAARNRTRSLEMTLVQEEQSAKGPKGATVTTLPRTPSDATFSLPPKTKLFAKITKV